jgi:hypothetical protein
LNGEFWQYLVYAVIMWLVNAVSTGNEIGDFTHVDRFLSNHL